MKLTHFALAGLTLLLVAGVYLTMQSDMDGRLDEQKAAYDRKIEQLEKAIQQKPAAPPVVADAQEALRDAAAAAKAKTEKVAGEAAGDVKKALSRVADTVKGAVGDEPGTEATDIDDTAKRVRSDVEEIANRARASVAGAADRTTDAINTKAGELAGAARTAADELVNRAAAAVTPAANDGDEVDPATRRLLDKEQREVLNTSGVATERMALDNAGGAEAEGGKMTKLQELIKAQPAIARITDAGDGFVVLDRGSNVGLARGDSFAVRRGTWVIGRVTVGDTVNPTECVADITKVDAKGMVFQKGDEAIKFDR